MNKWKLYLDTSVISYLDQKDVPENMRETRRFWKKVKAGTYDIVFSEVGLREIHGCSNEKRELLLRYLAEVEHTFIDINKDIERIAEKVIQIANT